MMDVMEQQNEKNQQGSFFSNKEHIQKVTNT